MGKKNFYDLKWSRSFIEKEMGFLLHPILYYGNIASDISCNIRMIPGKLVLTDGTVWKGELFGANGVTDGEVVFSTAMAGYEQSLTDPSFQGQVLVFTYPMIGNYGVMSEERDDYGILKYFESDYISVRGVVVNECSESFSHFRGQKSFDAWLTEKNIVGITGIDTRALTQHLRNNGSMLGQILPDDSPVRDFKDITDPNTVNLVAEVSTSEKIIYTPPHQKKRIAMFDFGVKNNIIREFLSRNIEVIRLPWNSDLSLISEKIDGVFFSNGPGDPEVVAPVVSKSVQYALDQKIPFWGICLGNQILALAVGGKTKKMKYGHRGVNQPCRNTETGECVITSQNHGYMVDYSTLPEGWKVLWENLNDGTCEGIRHISLPAYSVQFHPEASPGPEDSAIFFDRFIVQL